MFSNQRACLKCDLPWNIDVEEMNLPMNGDEITYGPNVQRNYAKVKQTNQRVHIWCMYCRASCRPIHLFLEWSLWTFQSGPVSLVCRTSNQPAVGLPSGVTQRFYALTRRCSDVIDLAMNKSNLLCVFREVFHTVRRVETLLGWVSS